MKVWLHKSRYCTEYSTECIQHSCLADTILLWISKTVLQWGQGASRKESTLCNRHKSKRSFVKILFNCTNFIQIKTSICTKWLSLMKYDDLKFNDRSIPEGLMKYVLCYTKMHYVCISSLSLGLDLLFSIWSSLQADHLCQQWSLLAVDTNNKLTDYAYRFIIHTFSPAASLFVYEFGPIFCMTQLN